MLDAKNRISGISLQTFLASVALLSTCIDDINSRYEFYINELICLWAECNDSAPTY